MPREMQGHRKYRLGEYVEFYESLFEKPEMRETMWTVCSFQWIRDEMYVLSRKQESIMNEIKKVKQEWNMDQKLILSSKLNEMKAKNDLIQRERDQLKDENDAWKTKEQERKTKENEVKTKSMS
ncbi:hypothetical protein TNCV_1050501 [Trichonephila clavipes]|nr:hypothetical protein TNCV_1050501 [Trichonephila clavipes]